MTEDRRILIVGAGHAGAQAAIALRRKSFPGSITILGEEPHLPYERPALSKEYLSGAKTWERMLLLSAQGWRERNISVLSDQRVVNVDAAAHMLVTASGERHSYDALIWATGGRPRRLTCVGHDVAGVFTVRNRDDVDELISRLPNAQQVIVVGGGFIGLEAAAVLIKQGKDVTILEALDRVLARVAGEPLSRFYESEHRSHGVRILLGAVVECILVDQGHAVGIRLNDGTELPAQMIVVGIGIVPAVESLIAAGANNGNGIRIDEFCRTSLLDIFAIGDCAEHRNRYCANDWTRLECVQNAHDQADVVAAVLTGQPMRYESIPWFWSNQYDLRLQTIGLARGYDDIIVRGNIADRSFSIVYLRDGTIIALDCVNAPRDFMQGKTLIMRGTKPNLDAAANIEIPLKHLLMSLAQLGS